MSRRPFEVPGWAYPPLAVMAMFAFMAVMFGLIRLASWASAPPDDPERARFMLECVYDWERPAQECRAILAGEDPAPAPQFGR